MPCAKDSYKPRVYILASTRSPLNEATTYNPQAGSGIFNSLEKLVTKKREKGGGETFFLGGGGGGVFFNGEDF
jgi:hypothetical protein